MIKSYIYTFPKSGTYFLKKMFSLVKEKHNETLPQIRHIPTRKNPCEGESLQLSRIGALHFQTPLNYNPNAKYIVTIRDLRDYLISCLNWLDKSPAQKTLNHPNRKRWDKISFDQKLLEYINLDRSCWPYACVKSHYVMLETFLHLKKLNNQNHNVLFIKFEDLLGNEFGGNDLNRLGTVKKMFDFLEFNIDHSEIKSILSVLDEGKTHTFNSSVKKKIGQWKTKFKPFHVKEFKKTWGKYLIELGYEKNNNWD